MTTCLNSLGDYDINPMVFEIPCFSYRSRAAHYVNIYGELKRARKLPALPGGVQPSRFRESTLHPTKVPLLRTQTARNIWFSV